MYPDYFLIHVYTIEDPIDSTFKSKSITMTRVKVWVGSTTPRLWKVSIKTTQENRRHSERTFGHLPWSFREILNSFLFFMWGRTNKTEGTKTKDDESRSGTVMKKWNCHCKVKLLSSTKVKRTKGCESLCWSSVWWGGGEGGGRGLCSWSYVPRHWGVCGFKGCGLKDETF